MKWEISKEPKSGTKRTIHYFTWFPKDILGNTYWLEFITVEQEYCIAQCEGMTSGWCDVLVIG